jgi:hypothetical protein
MNNHGSGTTPWGDDEALVNAEPAVPEPRVEPDLTFT